MSAIILGGGIAGLAAAYELAARNVPFTLLEASDRLGGLIRTETIDGFTIECGADSMLTQKPAALALCDELGLSSRLVSTLPPRTAYIHARGRLFPIPSPSVLGIPTTSEGLRSYALLPDDVRRTIEEIEKHPPGTHAPHGDESVADFYRRHFGPGTVSLIAEPLLAGIHAGDVERLSIASVAPRLVAAEAQGGHILDALRAAPAPSSADGLFRSLPGGMRELVDAIVTRLPANAVHTNRAALSIARSGSRWTVATTSGSLDADTIVVTTPAHTTTRLLTTAAPEIAALCAEVPYVSTASVALAWPRPRVAHPLAGSGFVVSRRHSALRVTACSWVSSKWSGRAPQDAVLLRAFLGGALDPDVVHLSDEEIVAIAVRDLSTTLAIDGPPSLARVHRWIGAGAQHNVGHHARVAAIDRLRERVPGLFLAGSGFRAIGVPDCIADGRAAAAGAADYAKIQS